MPINRHGFLQFMVNPKIRKQNNCYLSSTLIIHEVKNLEANSKVLDFGVASTSAIGWTLAWWIRIEDGHRDSATSSTD